MGPLCFGGGRLKVHGTYSFSCLRYYASLKLIMMQTYEAVTLEFDTILSIQRCIG